MEIMKKLSKTAQISVLLGLVVVLLGQSVSAAKPKSGKEEPTDMNARLAALQEKGMDTRTTRLTRSASMSSAPSSASVATPTHIRSKSESATTTTVIQVEPSKAPPPAADAEDVDSTLLPPGLDFLRETIAAQAAKETPKTNQSPVVNALAPSASTPPPTLPRSQSLPAELPSMAATAQSQPILHRSQSTPTTKKETRYARHATIMGGLDSTTDSWRKKRETADIPYRSYLAKTDFPKAFYKSIEELNWAIQSNNAQDFKNRLYALKREIQTSLTCFEQAALLAIDSNEQPALGTCYFMGINGKQQEALGIASEALEAFAKDPYIKQLLEKADSAPQASTTSSTVVAEPVSAQAPEHTESATADTSASPKQVPVQTVEKWDLSQLPEPTQFDTTTQKLLQAFKDAQTAFEADPGNGKLHSARNKAFNGLKNLVHQKLNIDLHCEVGDPKLNNPKFKRRIEKYNALSSFLTKFENLNSRWLQETSY